MQVARTSPRKAIPTSETAFALSNYSCHQLQADNAVLKEALASSAVPHARPVRPQSAGLPQSRAVLSRSSSAVLAISIQVCMLSRQHFLGIGSSLTFYDTRAHDARTSDCFWHKRSVYNYVCLGPPAGNPL